MLPSKVITADLVGDSTELNNLGIDHLRHGRLDEAFSVLSLAAILNENESYDSLIEDCPIYCNQWQNIAHVIQAVEAATVSSFPQDVKLSIFPCCLTIQKPCTIVSDKCRDQVVFTSRLDWIIEYNLALVAQLLGTLHGDVKLLEQAHNLYDQLGKDILEWHDYSTTVDIALLLIAIYNNEGCIYHVMGVNDLACFYMDRVSVIYSGCANLEANPICRTFEDNCPAMRTHDCAPAA